MKSFQPHGPTKSRLERAAGGAVSCCWSGSSSSHCKPITGIRRPCTSRVLCILQRPTLERTRCHCSADSANGSAAATGGSPAAAPAAEYQALLDQLFSLPTAELHAYVAEQRTVVNAPFLFWLADREKAAAGAQRQRLGALASEIVTIQVEQYYFGIRCYLHRLHGVNALGQQPGCWVAVHYCLLSLADLETNFFSNRWMAPQQRRSGTTPRQRQRCSPPMHRP